LCVALGIEADSDKKANYKNKETDCIENEAIGSTIGRKKYQGLIRVGLPQHVW
jgi:hypothetical protein